MAEVKKGAVGAKIEENLKKYRGDIRNLNRAYLTLAREMVREDPEQAYAVMGISTTLRSIIKDLTLEQIEKLSNEVNILQFSLRVSDRHFSRMTEIIDCDEDNGVPMSLISAVQAIDIES